MSFHKSVNCLILYSPVAAHIGNWVCLTLSVSILPLTTNFSPVLLVKDITDLVSISNKDQDFKDRQPCVGHQPLLLADFWMPPFPWVLWAASRFPAVSPLLGYHSSNAHCPHPQSTSDSKAFANECATLQIYIFLCVKNISSSACFL